MNISTNQNRQLYVAKAYSASVDQSSAKGTLGGVKVIGIGNEKELTFSYKGADTTMRSDRINLKNLDYVKAFRAADMIVPLKKVKVVLDSSINSGNPITGQDYVLAIDFHQWIGSDERYQYIKDAAVHATAAMAADKKEFYKAMVSALNLAFSREIGATASANPYLTFSAGTAGSEDGIYITEKEQSWNRGTEQLERVLFSVRPTTVYDGTEDVIWGTQTDVTPAKYVKKGGSGADKDDLVPNSALVAGTNAIGNGKTIADLEYFCMGERGDQYRNMGWPNVINTEYLITDPSAQYNVLEFHFAYTDEGVNSYRSEKDITIVVPVGASGSEYTVINNIIGAINTAVGSTIVETLA